MNPVTDINVIKSCILGHAVGDALGVPVEFSERADCECDPVLGMRGYGTYAVPAGTWSDDTSMTLCALDSLAKPVFSWDDVMQNFTKWLHTAAFTATDEVFDVGGTCQVVINNYASGKCDAAHCGERSERDNGNGSLMRILPFALYAQGDLAFVEQASSLTHAHRRSQMACGIYALVLSELLREGSKDSVRTGIRQAAGVYSSEQEWQHFAPLLDIESRSRGSISSSGYVVSSLEAALWCLLTTESYQECVLKAVNLGSDTDTVAAIAGGLAGVMYGLDSIPDEWLTALRRRDFIEELCERAALRWRA